MKIIINKVLRYSIRSIREFYYILKYNLIKSIIKIPYIKSIEETIKNIIDSGASVSRFGDGEFKWIEHIVHDSFQDDSKELSFRLKEVLGSRLANHLVCISPAFHDLDYCERESKKYWSITLAKYGFKWVKHLEKNRPYYNANISRFYLNTIDKSLCKDRFLLIKKVWHDRHVLIVEGEKTRLGVGNDLFENALSVDRVLVPARNAFGKYVDILLKAKKYGLGKLILIAVGPTATVLAYDLAMSGYQAVDIGHIDIEYQWYLMGAKRKVPVTGREVNEARTSEKLELHGEYEEKYLSQIIDRI